MDASTGRNGTDALWGGNPHSGTLQDAHGGARRTARRRYRGGLAPQVSEHHEVPGNRKPRRRQEDEEPSRFSTHRSRSACHGKTWAARQGKMGEGAGCLGVKEKDLRACPAALPSHSGPGFVPR